MPDRTGVAFTGARAVTAPATWSQLGIWRTMRKTAPGEGRMNIRFAVRVPAGRTVAQVADVVGELVSEHEALRTLHPLSAEGELYQAVQRVGEMPVVLVEQGDPAAGELADTPFDHSAELPVRAVVLRRGEVPVELLVVLSPLVVDWVAELLLRHELVRRLAGVPIRRPATRLCPADVAIEESSAAGQRANRLAVARWAEFVAEHEPTNFPVRLPETPGPRWVGATLRSRRLAGAADRLREELSASPAATYHAASAVMISALSGRDVAVMHNMTSNRPTRATAECLGRLAQASVSAVDVAAHPFREVVLRTASASVRSYAMGHYSTADVDAVVDADLFDGFHNSRFHTFADPVTGGGGGGGADRELTGWEPLSFNTHQFKAEVSHDGGVAELTLVTDRWYLPTSAPDLLLTAMESLVVEAAADPAGPAAVKVVERLL